MNRRTYIIKMVALYAAFALWVALLAAVVLHVAKSDASRAPATALISQPAKQ
jgi:hypothetical protein